MAFAAPAQVNCGVTVCMPGGIGSIFTCLVIANFLDLKYFPRVPNDARHEAFHYFGFIHVAVSAEQPMRSNVYFWMSNQGGMAHETGQRYRLFNRNFGCNRGICS